MIVHFESRSYKGARVISFINYLINLISVLCLYGGIAITCYNLIGVIFRDEEFQWNVIWVLLGAIVVSVLLSIIGNHFTDILYKLKLKLFKQTK